jgi:hypothetical protein
VSRLIDGPIRRYRTMNRKSVTAALIAGIIASTLIYPISKALGLRESFAMWGIAAALFFIAAFCSSVIQRRTPWTMVVALFVGVSIGTFAEAIYAPAIYGEDRNLWPLAIVLWVAIGTIPAFAGLLLGRFARRS